MRKAKRERTIIEKIIVTLWDIVVFCGVAVLALEVPAFLSEHIEININTFTVKVLILVGFVSLYGKANDIKNREIADEYFEKTQDALSKQQQDN